MLYRLTPTARQAVGARRLEVYSVFSRQALR
jgi:hypothetical protein